MQSQTPFRRESSSSFYSVLVVLLVASIGIMLAVQGWNSRSFNFDNVDFIDGADQLLLHGTLPDRGDVSSYWVYATPGPAWLMIPGMLVFTDPRLYEVAGSALLYIGTLAGLFLIARKCFGPGAAYLSLVLCGFSQIGLFYAGSLWSVGHPFFYVWTIYFCIRWIQGKSSKYLAWALVTWSIGFYVDMVLAPGAFIFPVLWLIYRPKLKITPLLLTAAVVAVVWFPYIRLQTNRNFVDLKSLVMRQRTRPGNYKAAWCNPNLVARVWNQSVPAPKVYPAEQPIELKWYSKLTKKIRGMYLIAGDGLTFNFDQPSWVPGSSIGLLLLGAATVIFIAFEAFFTARFVRNVTWRNWIAPFSGMAILLALLINEFVIARFLSNDGSLSASTVLRIRAGQAALLFVGLALFWKKDKIAEFLQRMTQRKSADNDRVQERRSRTLFALGVVVPWLALLMVVEPGAANRYWWLWPPQALAIAAAITYIPKRFGWPRAAAWVAQAVVVLAVVSNPAVVSRLQEWASGGWSGARSDDIQAVDFIAAQVLSEGRNTVALGYPVYFPDYMVVSNFVDPRYKVGGALDLYLRDRYGITNSNRCAEGVSSADEYRIIQTAPTPAQSSDAYEFFDFPADPGFHLEQQHGLFQVLKRVSPPAEASGR